MRRSRSEASVITVGPALLRRWPLPDPGQGDKETRGRVLVVGGGHQMPGPVLLAATAALRAGAGKLQIATVATMAPHVATAMPEALVHALPERRDGSFSASGMKLLVQICQSAQGLVMGPGMMENQALRTLVMGVLAKLAPQHSVVLDAGALTILAKDHSLLARTKCALIATPHAGEMAALLGREKAGVQAEPLHTVMTAARVLRSVVVLKGAHTLISDGRTTYRNVAGNVGLATSGSGDTLAGLIAGLAARGAEPMQAAVWGVYLHARAGDVLAKKLGPIGYLARELVREVPALMARLANPRN